jgi:hypothetical protein
MKIDCKDKDGEDLAAEIRGIKAFPCTLEMYDRVFQIANRGEAVVLAHGVEIGFFVAQDMGEHINGLSSPEKAPPIP